MHNLLLLWSLIWYSSYKACWLTLNHLLLILLWNWLLSLRYRWNHIKLLLNCFNRVDKLIVLIPVEKSWALIVVSSILNTTVSYSWHNLNLRSNHWEALAEYNFNIQRSIRNIKSNRNSPLLSIWWFFYQYCVWQLSLDVLHLHSSPFKMLKTFS